jgi:hypothetical protein
MPYVPKYGGWLSAAFPPQFPNATVSRYSLATVLIEQFSNDGTGTVVSHGTGFLWRAGSSVWLVTARHVLTGRNPFDDTHISETHYEPSIIRVHAGFAGAMGANRLHQNFEVNRDDGSPAWAADPQFTDLRTDIAALPINVGHPDVVCINDDEDFSKGENLFSHVGFQCFVIGYPTTSVTGLMLPIWRSGSIASDPGLAIDDKPIFLLDAATGPGFSGSPVLRVHIGPAPFHDPAQGTGIKIETDAVVRSKFVGVYAGRLNHPHVGAQTPYVFYGNRVPIIIAANKSRAPVHPLP